jgi:hypothetical protein
MYIFHFLSDPQLLTFSPVYSPSSVRGTFRVVGAKQLRRLLPLDANSCPKAQNITVNSFLQIS